MKASLILLLSLLACPSLLAQHKTTGRPVNASKDSARSSPAMTFPDGTVYDFGEQVEGAAVAHKFIFKNTGSQPLSIQHCTGSGANVYPSDWTKQPVPPGKTGYVKVVVGTQGRLGTTNKTIWIFHNLSSDPVELTVKGTVESTFDMPPVAR